MSTPTPPSSQVQVRAWLWVLLGGVGAYALVELLSQGVPRLALLPVSLLLGSFLLPFVGVLILEEGAGPGRPPLRFAAVTFLAGGLTSLLLAHLLTPRVGRLLPSQVLAVALSEELAKLVPVLLLCRWPGFAPFIGAPRIGLLMGGAAGLGFAAFESMGVAFTHLIQSGLSRGVMEQILAVRSVLGPVAHGSWTAAAGLAWFGAPGGSRWIRSGLALSSAVTLHALWNLPRLAGGGGLEGMLDPRLPWLPLPLWHLAVGALSLWNLRLWARLEAPTADGRAPGSS